MADAYHKRSAVSRMQYEAANGRNHPASFGVNRRQSCLPVKDGSTTEEAGNIAFIIKETVGIAIRTPWF
jgi:hypothetical protein